MAFTRYHDDPIRIMKHLQESTDQGVYHMQVPGNGDKMAFVADPQMRLQKWGANRHMNFTQVESELWGMQHKLTRDCDQQIRVNEFPLLYSTTKDEVTKQSRILVPAWELRSVEQNRWDPVEQDLQAHAMIPFQHNANARRKALDNYRGV